MIRAFLNSKELKLYPDTAIGMTIENFNISDISNRKIDRTNSITVPKFGNETVFEFASLPNAPSDFAYNDYDFDLIVDGIKVYENGRAFIVGEDQDSYQLNITNNKNIIDLLKSIQLADLYSGDTVTLVNTTTWKNLFTTKTNGFKIDYLYNEDTLTGDTYNFIIWQKYVCIYLDTILAKIEADYDITFSGDLLTDADFLKMRIPMVSSGLKKDWDTTNIVLYQIVIHDSLTAWDLLKNIMQLFCAVFKISGNDIELQKFNDIDIATPINWTGKIVSSSKKFAIPDTSQENYLKYSVGDEVDDYALSVLIPCNNTNINIKNDLATMKSKLFLYLDVNQFYTNGSAEPLLGIFMPKKETFTSQVDASIIQIKGLKDIVILVDSDEYLGQPLALDFHFTGKPGEFDFWEDTALNGNVTTDAGTKIVKYYDPAANYSLIETMLTDPVFYEAELLLNIVDINDFDHFKAVRIDELQGIFYVNKIRNFLATSPGIPTKVELIKIS